MLEEQLKNFDNTIIKIKVNENKDVPYEFGTFITYLKYDKILKHYVLNHPYNIDKNYVSCGEANFDYNDIEFIEIPSAKEKELWAVEYIKFHNSLLKENGSDYCSIDISIIKNLLPNTLDLKLSSK